MAAAAQLNRAELVVLGGHWISRAATPLFGDLAHRVLAEVDCPVMAASATGSDESGPSWPARRPKQERLLLGLAGPHDVEPLIAAALEVAYGSSTEVLVVHCCEAVTGAEAWAFVELEDVGREFAAQAVKALRDAGLRASVMSVPAVFDIAQRLLELSDEWPADLILMGSRTRLRLANLLWAGVEQRVMRRAHCPVMLVGRSPQKGGEMSDGRLGFVRRSEAKNRFRVLGSSPDGG